MGGKIVLTVEVDPEDVEAASANALLRQGFDCSAEIVEAVRDAYAKQRPLRVDDRVTHIESSKPGIVAVVRAVAAHPRTGEPFAWVEWLTGYGIPFMTYPASDLKRVP